MTIHWRDELSIDRGFIDRDHKHLIDVVNRFEAEIDSADARTTLVHTLGDLKHYVREHFRREEAYQQDVEYPHRMKHAAEHRELECRLDTVIQHFMAAVERGDYKPIAQEAAGLLRHWLIDHIIKSDLKLKEHLIISGNLLRAMGRAP
ncbi:MAG TPA: bacteriohemerythrin [Azospirillum sp.]|nr:bacteriohemerythrin [Azospirillum sp.]